MFYSGIEHENDIYSCAQLEANNNNEKLFTKSALQCSEPIAIVAEVKHEPIVIEAAPIVPSPQSSPTSILSDRQSIEPVTASSAVAKCIIKPVAPAPVPAPLKEHRPRSVTASVFAPVTADITPQLIALHLRGAQSNVNGIPAVSATAQPGGQFGSVKSNGFAAKSHQLLLGANPTLTAVAAGVLPFGVDSEKTQNLAVGAVDGGAAMNKGYMMFLEDGNDSEYYFGYFK